MQNTTVNFYNQKINVFAQEERLQEEALSKAVMPAQTRYEKLSSRVKSYLEDWMAYCSSERELVAAIDNHFKGEVRQIASQKDASVTFSWQGYSKIADIAVEEYQRRVNKKH